METTISQIKYIKYLNITDFNTTEEIKRAKVVLESISSCLKAMNLYLIDPNVTQYLNEVLKFTTMFVNNPARVNGRIISHYRND